MNFRENASHFSNFNSIRYYAFEFDDFGCAGFRFGSSFTPTQRGAKNLTPLEVESDEAKNSEDLYKTA